MKKKLVYIVLLIYIYILVGCTSTDHEEYITPEKQAEIWGEQIMECFINKDKETLKGLFNKKMNQKYNLDVRIQELFDYFDGEIISYNEPFGGVGGGEMSESKGKVKEGVYCRISQVKTNENASYNIYISAYTIYTDDEDYLGIDGISIRNVDLFAEDSENPDAELTLSYDK